MWFMPYALATAYGVTSICRFIQAATALSIVPTVSAPCLGCSWDANCLIDFYILVSAVPCQLLRHSSFNRRHSSALHPVFTQLVHTVL